MSYRDEFEKIMEGIKISPTAPKEEVDRQFLPLIQFIGKNVPEQLYKFRGCAEYSIDAFEKDELWLSKAALFNDLHDSLCKRWDTRTNKNGMLIREYQISSNVGALCR